VIHATSRRGSGLNLALNLVSLWPHLPEHNKRPTNIGEMLVGAVGIEIIMSQNLKEFCGMSCSRKSFAVLGRNYCCPRIAPAFL
jgi:hypothetical protein